MEKQLPKKEEKAEANVPDGILVKESPGVWKAKYYGMSLRELNISREGGVRVKFKFPETLWLDHSSMTEVRAPIEFVYDPKTLKVIEIRTPTNPPVTPPNGAVSFEVVEDIEGVEGLKAIHKATFDNLSRVVTDLLGNKLIEKDFEDIMGFKPKLDFLQYSL